jgi:hypothetical protein
MVREASQGNDARNIYKYLYKPMFIQLKNSLMVHMLSADRLKTPTRHALTGRAANCPVELARQETVKANGFGTSTFLTGLKDAATAFACKVAVVHTTKGQETRFMRL